MRSNYPISSTELNDIIYSAFENLTYLIGYENASGVIISGYLDQLETSITNCFLSGILSLNDVDDLAEADDFLPFSGYLDIADFLKMDYIYRKHFETEE